MKRLDDHIGDCGAESVASTTAQILFIESNTSGTGRLFARRARELGLRPLMICADPGRYPYLSEDGVDVIALDTSDHEKLIEACRAAEKIAPLAGVTSSSEYWIGAAAKVAARLGLHGPSAEAIEICRNKYLQRRRLADAGIAVPRFEAVTNSARAIETAVRIGLPVVVKPVAGSGSVGVRLCRTLEEVARHADSLTETTPSRVDVLPTLIESYVDAPEFSAECFDGRLLGVTRKHVSPPPNFVEIGHDHPASLAEERLAQIDTFARAALRALGLGWGAAHMEFRSGPDGPMMIEVNPRLAGGFIPELARLSTGVDLIDAVIRKAAGLPLDLAPKRHAHASIRFLIPPRPGVLTSVAGLEEARKMRGVEEVALYRPIGERLALQGDFRDRIGHVIASSDSADAGALADAAFARIRITVESS